MRAWHDLAVQSRSEEVVEQVHQIMSSPAGVAAAAKYRRVPSTINISMYPNRVFAELKDMLNRMETTLKQERAAVTPSPPRGVTAVRGVSGRPGPATGPTASTKQRKQPQHQQPAVQQPQQKSGVAMGRGVQQGAVGSSGRSVSPRAASDTVRSSMQPSMPTAVAPAHASHAMPSSASGMGAQLLVGTLAPDGAHSTWAVTAPAAGTAHAAVQQPPSHHATPHAALAVPPPLVAPVQGAAQGQQHQQVLQQHIQQVHQQIIQQLQQQAHGAHQLGHGSHHPMSVAAATPSIRLQQAPINMASSTMVPTITRPVVAAGATAPSYVPLSVPASVPAGMGYAGATTHVPWNAHQPGSPSRMAPAALHMASSNSSSSPSVARLVSAVEGQHAILQLQARLQHLELQMQMAAAQRQVPIMAVPVTVPGTTTAGVPAGAYAVGHAPQQIWLPQPSAAAAQPAVVLGMAGTHQPGTSSSMERAAVAMATSLPAEAWHDQAEQQHVAQAAAHGPQAVGSSSAKPGALSQPQQMHRPVATIIQAADGLEQRLQKELGALDRELRRLKATGSGAAAAGAAGQHK